MPEHISEAEEQARELREAMQAIARASSAFASVSGVDDEVHVREAERELDATLDLAGRQLAELESDL